MWERLKLFFTFWDSHFEDLVAANWGSIVYRYFSAGLVLLLGLFGPGKAAERVPNSVVVGLTSGIAHTIALSNVVFVPWGASCP